MLRTIPLCLEPTGYLAAISVHGSGCNCLMPNDILRSSLSNVNTTASISSPNFIKSEGLRKCWLQLISETWIRPSTPVAISKNAP